MNCNLMIKSIMKISHKIIDLISYLSQRHHHPYLQEQRYQRPAHQLVKSKNVNQFLDIQYQIMMDSLWSVHLQLIYQPHDNWFQLLEQYQQHQYDVFHHPQPQQQCYQIRLISNKLIKKNQQDQHGQQIITINGHDVLVKGNVIEVIDLPLIRRLKSALAIIIIMFMLLQIIEINDNVKILSNYIKWIKYYIINGVFYHSILIDWYNINFIIVYTNRNLKVSSLEIK